MLVTAGSKLSHGRVKTVRSILVIALFAAAGTFTSCSAVGGGRSEQAFCRELKAGNDKMRKTYEGASDDVGGQLGVVFVNMGEFTTMLHKLDEVAPDGIKVEMHDSREAWDTNGANAKDVASNPLGALAGALMTSMMSNASMRAVDKYGQNHCGVQVFGTFVDKDAIAKRAQAAAASASASAAASASADAETWTCDDLKDPDTRIDGSDTDYASLTRTVNLMATADSSDVATAATKLKAQLNLLDPEPGTSLEALARVGYGGGTTAADLFTAIGQDCPDQSDAADAMAQNVAGTGPVRDGDTLKNVGSIYGACTDPRWNGLADADTAVVWCNGVGLAVISLITGAVQWIGDDDVDQPFVDPPNESFDGGTGPAVLGHTAAWTHIDRNAATGLSPLTWDAQLLLYNFDTGHTTQVPLVQHGEGDGPSLDEVQPGSDGAGFFVTIPQSGMSGARRPSSQLRHFSAGGQLQWQWADKAGGTATAEEHPLTRMTALIGDQGQLLVDVRNGHVLANYGEDGSTASVDDCGQHSEVQGRTPMWVTDTAAGLSTVKLSGNVPGDDENGNRTIPAGVLSSNDNDDGFHLVRTNGTVAWELSEDVVNDIVGVGAWVVATNLSGDQVLVDPETGKEAASADAAVRDAVLASAKDGGTRPLLTPDGQDAWVDTGDDFAKLPAGGFCGSASAATNAP